MVQIEEHYSSATNNAKYVTKRDATVTDIIPSIVLSKGVEINPKKVIDVNNLLMKHYGPDWKLMDGLKFYVNIIKNENNNSENVHTDCL